MNIKTRYSAVTAGLIGAVVAAVALTVTAAERRVLEAESRERVEALVQGAARLAQESLDGRDQLMLVSYVMDLQKAHPELALAAITRRGHTATVGEEKPGLVYWERVITEKRPVTFTVKAPAGSTPDLAVSTAGVSLTVAGSAGVVVQEARVPETMTLKLGFDRRLLEAEIARAMGRMARQTAGIAAAFMALGGLAAMSFGTLLTKPLALLASAAGAVGRGDLDVKVGDESRKDEIGALARSFNGMTGKLKAHTQFREDLLHTLTHELNTPLGALKGYLEIWQDRQLPAEPAARAEAVETMLAAVLRMEQSLGSALKLFRGGAALGGGPKRLVWLDDLCREVATLFAPVARSKRVTLALPPPEASECLYAEEDLLRQIAVNLVSNALKYTPEGGRVAVSMSARAGELRLVVADTGYGIAAEDLPHLFTKFYRAGGDGRRIPGTGLGLTIAQKAAQALGGRIEVESEVGRGSTFTVILPKTLPQETLS